MLEIRNLSVRKITENRSLIDDLSFTLNKGDKFAIIGLEGNGKSTLLKIILGMDLDYIEYTGSVNYKKAKIGYLPQSIKADWNDINVIDFLLKDNPKDSINVDAYAKLSMLDKTLNYVNFDKDIFDDSKNIAEYSGGEVVKLGLTKMLLKDPDILLLDEPTNDLDLDTVLFLENFIQNEKRPILFISHDEALLQNTANGIIHLVQTHKKTKAQSFFEKCSYDEYKTSRNLMIASQSMIAKKERSNFKKKMEKYRQIYQKVEHLQNQTVRNPTMARLLAKKIKSLKSTEKRFNQEKENFTEIPEVEEEIWLFFDEDISIPNNRVLIDYHIESLEVEGKVLSRDINLLLKGPAKICIIGKNGSGKTTLLKDIHNRLKNRDNVNVGYVGQNYDEQLENNKSAVDILVDSRNRELAGPARKMMGALHFTTEEMLYNQTDLSGGQKAKLLLLKTVIDKANVLILDEPTRNLSPLSIPVIHNLLLNYKGAIICVSHDRNFIENVFEEVYVLNENGLNKL
ncbi:ATP-binding cassette domain-containing protein [Candidatus Izemoplasma sp. B36]|uniref:ATP-binding cassette domain-containing protein n=1 Tax=Candidatus Izemoplasma sp. B36 TaxID=3242468 RepID=UPI003557AE6C